MVADSDPAFARAPLRRAIDSFTAARLDVQHLQRQRAAGDLDAAEVDDCLRKIVGHLDALGGALMELRDRDTEAAEAAD